MSRRVRVAVDEPEPFHLKTMHGKTGGHLRQTRSRIYHRQTPAVLQGIGCRPNKITEVGKYLVSCKKRLLAPARPSRALPVKWRVADDLGKSFRRKAGGYFPQIRLQHLALLLITVVLDVLPGELRQSRLSLKSGYPPDPLSPPEQHDKADDPAAGSEVQHNRTLCRWLEMRDQDGIDGKPVAFPVLQADEPAIEETVPAQFRMRVIMVGFNQDV